MRPSKSTNVQPAGNELDSSGVRPPVAGTLITLALSMLLSSLGTSIANVGLPTLAQAFGASFQQVEWVVLAYLLSITSLVVSVGRLGDILGRRRLLLLGLVVFTVGASICGATSSLGVLVAARAVQGAGAAVMMALAMALVSETVPRERVGSAMGLLGTMSAIGTALGPSVGGFLIDGLGWQAMFWVNVPIGLLAIVFAFRFLPTEIRSTGADRPRFDVLGTLLLAGSLAVYALSMTLGHGHGGIGSPWLLGIAAAGLALFLVVQGKVASPLIRLTAFRDPTFSVGLVGNSLVATVIMTTFVVGPFYLSGSLGLSTARIGLIMAIGPVISALTGVVAGRLVDRFGAVFMAATGLVLLAVGTGALASLPMLFATAGYIAGIAILTPGYQLFQAANNTAVMMDVAADQRGVMSGMLGLSRNVGLITGASVMGAVFSFAAGADDVSTADAQSVSDGMQYTFECALALMGLAIGLTLGSRLIAGRREMSEQAE